MALSARKADRTKPLLMEISVIKAPGCCQDSFGLQVMNQKSGAIRQFTLFFDLLAPECY